MIAGDDDVGAGGQQVFHDPLVQTEAGGGVFRVDHDEVEAEPAAKPGQLLVDRVARGAADDIAEIENLHLAQPPAIALGRDAPGTGLADDSVESGVVRPARYPRHFLPGKADTDGQWPWPPVGAERA